MKRGLDLRQSGLEGTEQILDHRKGADNTKHGQNVISLIADLIQNGDAD
jgi:hypothetical protein